MKKLILSLLLTTVCGSMFAQGIKYGTIEYLAHEKARPYKSTAWAGTGIGGNSNASDRLSVINVGYGAMVAQNFYVGGSIAFGLGRMNEDLHAFAPMIYLKYNWLNTQHFGMYSRLGAGAAVYLSGLTSEGYALLTLQISPLGIEAGGNHLWFYGELGTGFEGVLNLGLRIKF